VTSLRRCRGLRPRCPPCRVPFIPFPQLPLPEAECRSSLDRPLSRRHRSRVATARFVFSARLGPSPRLESVSAQRNDQAFPLSSPFFSPQRPVFFFGSPSFPTPPTPPPQLACGNLALSPSRVKRGPDASQAFDGFLSPFFSFFTSFSAVLSQQTRAIPLPPGQPRPLSPLRPPLPPPPPHPLRSHRETMPAASRTPHLFFKDFFPDSQGAPSFLVDEVSFPSPSPARTSLLTARDEETPALSPLRHGPLFPS